MKYFNSPSPDHTCNDNTEGTLLSARQLLEKLPAEVVYAIERGVAEADQPLVSDLDIVITKRSFLVLYSLAKQCGMIVSVTLSYGGARLFITLHDGGIKRFDCMWNCSYLGIPICSTRQLLTARKTERNTGLYVLAENMQAEVAFAVKNAHGGAEKYRDLLERHGLKVLDNTSRRLWLLSLIVKHPLATLTGITRMTLAYTARLIFPSGITVFGASATELRNSDVLRYLFQGRIQETGGISGFIRSRLGAELCIISSRSQADIDLSYTDGLQSAEQAILGHLHKHQSRLPWLTIKIS